MAFFVPCGNPTDIYQEHWSYLRFVTVLPTFQGRGIGRELTNRCIDLAKRRGEKFLALHTSEMMPAAIHLYESVGFKLLKELPIRLGKRYWLYILQI